MGGLIQTCSACERNAAEFAVPGTQGALDFRNALAGFNGGGAGYGTDERLFARHSCRAALGGVGFSRFHALYYSAAAWCPRPDAGELDRLSAPGDWT